MKALEILLGRNVLDTMLIMQCNAALFNMIHIIYNIHQSKSHSVRSISKTNNTLLF